MPDEFHEIVERPVDIFYGGVINYIIISFKNRPEIDAVAETETFITFLRDTWNKCFSDIDDVLDFMRHCTYYTCLVGRFYRMNCFLPLDHVFYVLKDGNRLPNINSSFLTRNILHKLARLILIEYCSEYTSNISLYLDVHVKNGRGCDASDSVTSYLILEDLPNEQDYVLVFHITIIYNGNAKLLLTSSETSSNITSNNNDSTNYLCEKPEILKLPKCVSSQTFDSTSELPKGSNDNRSHPKDNPWEKYGAKPKTRCMQKNYSDASENQKSADIPLKLPRKQNNSTAFENATLSHFQSDLLREFEKIESSLQYFNNSNKKLQDLSLLPCSSTIKSNSPKRSFLNEPTNARNSSTLQMPVESLPPSSGITNQTDSAFENNKRFRNFVEECLSSKQLPSKYDQIFPGPSILRTWEGNRYPENCDERPRDDRCFQNLQDNISQNKDTKTQYFPEKEATITYTDKQDMVHSTLAPATEGVFATQEELDDMPDSKESARVEQSLLNERYTVGTQRDYSLQMPFIRFPPELTRQVVTSDDDNFYTFTTYIGLQVRASIFRYELKKFFENCQLPDVSSREFPETFMKSPAVRERYSPYYSTYFKSDPSTIEYPKTSSETSISNANNQAQAIIQDDFNSGHLAIGTFDDKISFNWNYFIEEKGLDIENLKATCLPETTSSKTSENDKVFIIDGEPGACGSSDEQCDFFFQLLIQKLTENPSSCTQSILPPDSTSMPASPNKKYSSPEQISKHCDDLNLVQLEKREDQIKFVENSEDEMLYDITEESLVLSDCESSCDEEFASEFEQ